MLASTPERGHARESLMPEGSVRECHLPSMCEPPAPMTCEQRNPSLRYGCRGTTFIPHPAPPADTMPLEGGAHSCGQKGWARPGNRSGPRSFHDVDAVWRFTADRTVRLLFACSAARPPHQIQMKAPADHRLGPTVRPIAPAAACWLPRGPSPTRLPFLATCAGQCPQNAVFQARAEACR